MQSITNKRDFQFKDVEKYKKEEINNENIRNLLKILFPEGKIEIITNCIKDIGEIKKPIIEIKKIQETINKLKNDFENKKNKEISKSKNKETQKISKSENNCGNKKNQEINKLKDKYKSLSDITHKEINKLKNKYKFLSDITDEEIENCDNKESILYYIFKYYLKQFKKGDLLTFINLIDHYNNYTENKELLRKLVSYCGGMSIEKEFLLNFVNIAEALKFKENFSIEERLVIVNILKNLNGKIKENSKKNRRSYFKAYKEIIKYDEENIELYENDICSTIKILNIEELIKFKNFIEKIDCPFRLKIIEQCCSSLLEKYKSDKKYLKIIKENLEDILPYCTEYKDKIKLLEILLKLVKTECKTGDSVNFLYSVYFDKLNTKEIIEDEFSKLKLDDYEKLINILKTKKYDNLQNITEIKGKLYFYYIKKMKEKKYDNKKIEDFIKNTADNTSIYSNVLTYLKEEIINNKQKEKFSTILNDNIEIISKIIKYKKCHFFPFNAIRKIIEDEKINKDEEALKTIYKILSSNIPEEENKKEELSNIPEEEENKKERFLEAFASILRMKVNINNKKCILAEVCDPKKSLSNDFKKIKENLKEIQDFQIFREFYFNDEKNKVNDEKYKDPEKLSVQSEKIIICETTKQDNTITQDTDIQKYESIFSSPSKPENTNNHEKSLQSKRTNTPTIG